MEHINNAAALHGMDSVWNWPPEQADKARFVRNVLHNAGLYHVFAYDEDGYTLCFCEEDLLMKIQDGGLEARGEEE